MRDGGGMCVLTLAWKAHPDWLLIAAGNRDEAHARTSAPLARWGGGVIGGRDLQSGGMWLGVSEAHPRFAVVTNVTGQGPVDPDRLTRGALVHAALTQREPFALARPDRYNPFNLIVFADDEIRVRTNTPRWTDRCLAPGWHGLSNGVLGNPWDRTEHLTRAAQDWIGSDGAQPDALLARLDDRDSDRSRPVSGPIFRVDGIYGTRCSTVVAVDQRGSGRMWERRFDAQGAVTGETEIAFHWLV